MEVQGPDLRQPMQMSQILERALLLYRQYPGPLLLIAAVTLPLDLLSAAASGAIEDTTRAALISLPISLVASVVSLLALGALARAVADVALGITPDFSRSYDAVFERLGRLILAALLALIIVALVAITIVGIPFAIYLAVRWAFVVQAVMLEDARPREALTLSGRLVSGYWWRTLGIILVISILAAVPIFVVSIIFALAPLLVSGIINAIMTVLVLPFVGAAYALLFFDLQAREASRASIA
jgi:hypothetical protein